jgi:hypothetical protein
MEPKEPHVLLEKEVEERKAEDLECKRSKYNNDPAHRKRWIECAAAQYERDAPKRAKWGKRKFSSGRPVPHGLPVAERLSWL